MRETTLDIISDRLQIAQHRRGYRFGLDALLLATDLPDEETWAARARRARVVELGAGHGAVALCIAARHKGVVHVSAIEREPGMCGLLRANVARNSPHIDPEALEVIEGDIRSFREFASPHTADLVVCNPPYWPKGSRRPSANPQRAAAHHELFGGFDDFLAASQYILDPKGWLKIILPPHRIPHLVVYLEPLDLKWTRARFVHTSPSQPAYLVECTLRRGRAKDLSISPPLFVREAHGAYSEEVARRVAGAALAGTPSPDYVEHVIRASRH